MEQIIKERIPWGMKLKNEGEKPKVMKYMRVAVLLFFMIGIISANIMDKEHLSEFQVLNTYFIEKFKYININTMQLFWHIFEIRVPIMLLLLLLTTTDFGMLFGMVFLTWQGFAAGFLMATAIISYGVKGILLIGTAAFPHYFIYIPLYIFCIYLSEFFKKRMRMGIRKQRKNIMLCFGLYVLTFAVYMAGIFLESHINPYLLQKML